MIRSGNPHLEQKQRPPAPSINKKQEQRKLNRLKRLLNTLAPAPSPQKVPEGFKSYNQYVTSAATPHARALKRRKARNKHRHRVKTKVCTHCLLEKAITDFDLQKDSTHPATQRRPYCFLCRKKKNAEAYQRRKNDLNRI